MSNTDQQHEKRVFIDSNCWFRSKKDFYYALSLGYDLVINPIVIYEIIKILDIEINLAKEQKKNEREKLCQSLKKRFPLLLMELEVFIVRTNLSTDEIDQLYSVMDQYDLDIGDVLIYWTMKKEKISRIMTNDQDWKRLPEIKIFEVKV